MIWSFPHQINLTFGRRLKRLHQPPACDGRAQRTRPFLITAFHTVLSIEDEAIIVTFRTRRGSGNTRCGRCEMSDTPQLKRTAQ